MSLRLRHIDHMNDRGHMTFRIELQDGAGTSSEPQLLTFLTRAGDAREGGGGEEATSNPETTGSP